MMKKTIIAACGVLVLLAFGIAFAGPTIRDAGSPRVDSVIYYAVIDHSSICNNTLVAATANRKIRVLSYAMTSLAAVAVRFESGADGTALTGQMNFTGCGIFATCNISVNCGEIGCFEAETNTLLNLELSVSTGIDGHLTYTLVP